ncbi:MAG: hypothetical protein GY757_52225 [bacterium]|nr:hypothetical protein [bacterium]
MGRNHPLRLPECQPLILEPAPDGTPCPADNVLIIPCEPLDREYYRIGIGIDLTAVFRKTPGSTTQAEKPKKDEERQKKDNGSQGNTAPEGNE